MKFNRTLAYGLACLSYLEKRNEGGWVEAKEIAQHENLPVSYCNKVLGVLARGGILRSSRGRGFKLSRSLDEISAWSLLEAFTVNGAPTKTMRKEPVVLYETLKELVDRMLVELTLEDVIQSAEQNKGLKSRDRLSA